MFFLRLCIVVVFAMQVFPNPSLGQSANYGIQEVDSLIAISDESEQLGDTTRVDLLTEIGYKLYYQIPDSAILFFDKAYDLAVLHSMLSRQSNILYGFGICQYVKADYNNSLKYFNESLELARMIDEPYRIARGLNGTGIALNMLTKSQKAIDNHKESLKICLQTNNLRMHKTNLFNISIAFDAMAKYDSALYYIDSALNMSLKENNTTEFFKYSNHKAYVLLNLDEPTKALKIFQSVAQAENYDNKWEKQFAIAGLAQTSLKLGDTKNSIQYGLKAYNMAKTMNALWDMQQVTKYLALSYEAIKDFEHAYHFQNLFKKYSDSIFSKDKEAEINHLLLTEQQLENKNLALENKGYENKIRNKNLVIIGIVFILTLAIIFSFILLRIYKEKKRLNSSKDRILKIIAHDLKTPIGVMIEFTELLKENLESYSTETIKKFLSSLHDSSEKGFELLNNLLSWAQSQTGSIPFHPREHNIKDGLDNSMTILNSQAELKNITIVNEIDPSTIIYADINMFRLIMRNLLINAIKFSHTGSKIIISFEKLDTETKICITDTGIGMDSKTQASLFKIETPVSLPGTQNEKGTGLGLSLCKDFISKHKGRIWVNSKKGEGSMFCFALPNYTE